MKKSEKWFSWEYVSNSFRKKKLSKWVKENVSNCFRKKKFSNKTFLFKKKWTIKQENNEVVCDTDSPWVIRQWVLSIIYICSPSLSIVTLFMCTSFLNTWRQVTRKNGQLQAVKPRDGTFTKIFEDMRIAMKITCLSHSKINKYPVNSGQVRITPLTVTSFLVKSAVQSQRRARKNWKTSVFPASPSVKVWFQTLNLPCSGSQMLKSPAITPNDPG